MSSLNPSTTPDDVLRIEALNQAIRYASNYATPDDLVKSAEIFYAFLKGQNA